MNIHYLEKIYNNFWNIKYIYNLYYYPFTTIFTSKNVYKASTICYPYMKDTITYKIVSKNRNKEKIELDNINHSIK